MDACGVPVNRRKKAVVLDVVPVIMSIMIENVQRLWWRAARPLTRTFGSKPLGIWIAWLGLASAAGKLLPGTLCAGCGWKAPTLEGVLLWAIIIAAAAALLRRRLIARTFVGIALAFLLRDALTTGDAWGIVLPPISFLSLLANRRWFDERLPNIG